jgi:hypothetical protein
MRQTGQMPRAQHRVSWREIAVPVGAREQARVDEKLEQRLRLQCTGCEPRMLVQVETPGSTLKVGGGDGPRPSCQVESILVLGEWVRVQRVAPVSQEITQLGRGDDEGEEPAGCDERAHGLDARTAVGPGSPEHGEPDAEVVEELPARLDQVGAGPTELGPREGGATLNGPARSAVRLQSKTRRCSSSHEMRTGMPTSMLARARLASTAEARSAAEAPLRG